MALTQEHVRALTKPFSAADHEFIRGFVYISELAITTRLDEVDPSWTFEVLSNIQRDRQMVATARMTLSEVFRDGVGMQSMEYLTDYDKATRTKTYRLDLDGNKIDAGEAEKSAATDALRRCARLFGIGRYLLDNPPKVITDDYGIVKDRKAFDEWLAGQQKAHADKWKYNPPSKIAGHIEPEPESEALPKAAGAENNDDFAHISLPDGGEVHARKRAVDDARKRLGNKHSIEPRKEDSADIKTFECMKINIIDRKDGANGEGGGRKYQFVGTGAMAETYSRQPLRDAGIENAAIPDATGPWVLPYAIRVTAQATVKSGKRYWNVVSAEKIA